MQAETDWSSFIWLDDELAFKTKQSVIRPQHDSVALCRAFILSLFTHSFLVFAALAPVLQQQQLLHPWQEQPLAHLLHLWLVSSVGQVT